MSPSPAQERSIEVTAEEAAALAANGCTSPSSTSASHRTLSSSGNSSSSVKKKLTKLIKPMGKNLHSKLNRGTSGSDFSSRQNYTSAYEADNASYNSESIGQMSVTPTVASLDTVKMSNRQVQELLQGNPNNSATSSNSQKEKKTPWKKLKRFIGIPPSNNNNNNNNNTRKTNFDDNDTICDNRSLSDAIVENGALPIPGRAHSKSMDYTGTGFSVSSTGSIDGGGRRRISSVDLPKANSKNKHGKAVSSLQQQQAMMDDALRGRLDGMDMLYLGPAYLISLERQNHTESSTPWEPAPSYSFAGRTTQYNSKQIVADMMRRSLGGDSPEIIMEGFFRDDRWLVTLDITKKSDTSAFSSGENPLDVDVDSAHDAVPSMQLTDEEDHSHSTAPDEIPRHKLWASMWGVDTKPPPKPSHMTSMDDIDPDSDSILEMAASCSVPVDVDEDTFMIGNAQHLQAVHDLASVPLQHGQFDEAMEIFDRILRGIEAQENDALRHLEGVTLHNMAVISMWQENYEQALELSGKAIKARLQYLPEGHPDIAVSLVRQGFAYFALEKYDMAEASFHAALDKITENNVVKAKVLSNLGVAQYQRGDDGAALKNFSDALEIQRLWLEGPVRRDTTVFSAAVMLGNMGKIHIKRGDYDLAVSVYEEALLLMTSILRADHDLVLANLVSLALAWAFNAEPMKAGQILNGVLRSQLSRMGPATAPVVETTGTIGNLHFGLGNYEDALKCFAPVLKWQKANLELDHQATRKTKDIMKKIKKSIQAVWV